MYSKLYFRSGAHNALYAGMRALESGTCLRFVERTNERDYLDFFVGSGCYSQVQNIHRNCLKIKQVGRNGGRQEISLANGCWYSHTVSHEVLSMFN